MDCIAPGQAGLRSEKIFLLPKLGLEGIVDFAQPAADLGRLLGLSVVAVTEDLMGKLQRCEHCDSVSAGDPA